MKHLKRFGIGCLLATAALAIAGSASASAEQSTFCKVNETPCSSLNHYPSGTPFVLTAKGTLKWVSYLFGAEYRKFECVGGKFEGKTTTTGGSTQAVEVSYSSVIVGSCTSAVVTLQVPKMKFNWNSGTMNAAVTTNGFSYQFAECRFWGEEIKEGTTLAGGSPAVLTFKEAPVKPEGCGTTAKFSGEFEVLAPKPLYVSSS
jgi:hypothetical protein